jgi:beta-N-acetylhexosaminidase
MLKRSIFAFLLLAILAVSGYLGYVKYYLPYKFEKLTEKILITAAAKLSPDDKATQLLHIAIPGKELNQENRKVIAALRPGGIIFFGFNLGTATEIKKFTTDLQSLARELNLPPFMISTDQEGGYVKRVLDGVLQTPTARRLGDISDAGICGATGYHVSRDLGELGINVFFAPIVDINNNPKNPVIGLRSFGTTLPAVLACALPFEEGAREAHTYGGALPVIKHFPGHGDTQVDSHWALPVINKDLAQLRSFELVPFQNSIKSGALAVMSAHILYPQVDKDAPATLSHRWLTDILRTDMKFTGLVFTDAMEMNAVSKYYATENRPIRAINAGADVLLYTSWQDDPLQARDRVRSAVRNGEFAQLETRTTLDRALHNQLRVKLAYLDVHKYLDSDAASWYEKYRSQLLAQRKAAKIDYTESQLQSEFKKARWFSREKHVSTTWRAGQANER